MYVFANKKNEGIQWRTPERTTFKNKTNCKIESSVNIPVYVIYLYPQVAIL
jgi:hypothetical protein